MSDVPPSKPASSPPDGMLKIPGGRFEFRVSGIEIEGSDWEGLDVQYPWETSPRRSHDHVMQVATFYIDRYPVTNADFKRFLDASRYSPADGHNFLRDWSGASPRPGWERKPVTWVSLEDARAYAKWAGKRLPHEWEWQYCAQGAEGRLYPWGNEWDGAAVPKPDRGRDLTGPDDVDAHPSGASPFGVMDLTGNVWQWTDEFTDAHTRAAVFRGRDLTGPDDVDAHPSGASPFGVMDLTGNVWQWTDEFTDPHTRAAVVRGGSYYQPQASIWY